MAKYDPVTMKDWQIAEIAEAEMIPFDEMCEKLGIPKDERIPYGQKIGRVDYLKCLERLKDKPDGYYIDVTAITPTPLGEGKSTTSLGLIEGLGKRGVNVGGALRQPSGGPTMNIKGTAAGGGISLLIPMTEFSLGLTGDINNIMNAHNLAMVAATSRLQHEFNYTDEQLAKRGLKRLNIDPKNFEMGWIIDFCAQALRNIIIGLGGKMDGFMMASKFGIAVSSEVMAILSVTTSLADLKKRLNEITVCYDKQGNPITTGDLEVGNAMTAWMVPSINPTLCQSVEGQPVFIHAGPFANIAVGQSSIIADQIGLKLFDYHVTESGFGADIGFEKFWNVKCRFSGLKPHVAVLTTTVRGLKHHGVNAGALPCPPANPSRSSISRPPKRPWPGWKTASRTQSITSAPSRKPASIRWSASMPSISTPRKSTILSAGSAKLKAPGWPSPGIGSMAVKAPWNLRTPSSTPARRKMTSGSCIPMKCRCGSGSN